MRTIKIYVAETVIWIAVIMSVLYLTKQNYSEMACKYDDPQQGYVYGKMYLQNNWFGV